MASIIHQRLSAWPAMLWRWSGNGAVWDPFHTLTLTHTHSGPRLAVDLPVNHHPHPSLPPRGQLRHVRWTAGTRDPENYWHQVQVGSCILQVRILWLAFEGHVTCVWQTFDLVSKDQMTCVEVHETGIWGPCKGHVTYHVACMWPICECGYVNVLICARTSYIDQMSASYDKRTSQEVVNLRLWEHLQVRCHSLLQLGRSSATHSPSFPPFSPSISFSPSPSLSLFLPQIKHLICMYTYTYTRGPL